MGQWAVHEGPPGRAAILVSVLVVRVMFGATKVAREFRERVVVLGEGKGQGRAAARIGPCSAPCPAGDMAVEISALLGGVEAGFIEMDGALFADPAGKLEGLAVFEIEIGANEVVAVAAQRAEYRRFSDRAVEEDCLRASGRCKQAGSADKSQ